MMNARLNQILLAVTLAVGLPLLTGCLAAAVGAGAAAGAGAIVYVKGELQSNLDAPLAKSVVAANQALSDLNFTQVSEETDGVSSRIKARTAQDQAVTISLKKLTDNATSAGIRIGTWGDREASQELLDRIKRGL